MQRGAPGERLFAFGRACLQEIIFFMVKEENNRRCMYFIFYK